MRWTPFSRRRASTAFLGLGANLGDRLATLRSALEELEAEPALTVEKVSSVYETEPWTGGVSDLAEVDQPSYLNLVAGVTTTLRPRELLRLVQRVEAAHGRNRANELRWGPRSLDIDVLLYDDRVVAEPDLVVPHPRLTERAFVLVPLAEVLPPGARLPDGTTVTSHLARLAPVSGVELYVRLQDGPGTATEPLARRPVGPRGAPPYLNPQPPAVPGPPRPQEPEGGNPG